MNDAGFAAARAESLAARGYGNEAIRAFLEQEGAGPEAAEAALGGLEAEADRVAALVARHGATPRLAAQLQRKGFAQEALEPAFEGVFADGDPGT